jgi:hypothetical protein
VRERHFVRGDEAHDFGARVGDLVFLCGGAGNADSHLPPPWNEVPLTSPLYGGRIAEPPRIAKKERWNPIHVTLNDLGWAITDVKWSLPPERTVLANLRIGEKLEEGLFLVPTDGHDAAFALEAPPSLRNRELLKPGEWVWVIMEKPRFDRKLRRLVLTAVDIESRYLVE